MSWHKPYNISGTIHVEDRLDELFGVFQEVIPGHLELIGTYIGEFIISGGSKDTHMMSHGDEVREFYVRVAEEGPRLISFANRLEDCLNLADFPYTLVVHDKIVNAGNDT